MAKKNKLKELARTLVRAVDAYQDVHGKTGLHMNVAQIKARIRMWRARDEVEDELKRRKR